MNFYKWMAAADARTPKTETIVEHRKHCDAKPGNCPFEKAISRADQSDNLRPSVHSTIPSLNGIRKHVSKREKGWIKKSGLTAQEFLTVKKNLKTTLDDIIARTPIGICVRAKSQLKKEPIISAILHAGFKNLYETGEGGGTTDQKIRKGTENYMFGWSDSHSVDDSARPKYGMAINGDKLKNVISKMKGWSTRKEIDAERKRPTNEYGIIEYYGTSDYGDNFIVLKKSRVMSNTTFEMGDSMDNVINSKFCTPSLTNEPSPVSLPCPQSDLVTKLKSGPILGASIDELRRAATTFGLPRYLEFQFHGSVTPSDIAEIRFKDDSEYKNAKIGNAEWSIIKKNGIKVSVGGKQIVK